MNLWNLYKHGFNSAKSHWKFIILVVLINALFSYIIISPLTILLKNSLSESLAPHQLNSGFEFTLITEIIRENSKAIVLSINHFVLMIFLYLIWSIFYTGGFLGLINNSVGQNKAEAFWKSGSIFFFKLLRLSFYIFLTLLFVLGLYFLSFFNLNLLEAESEMGLIRNFKIFILIFCVYLFFIGIFKDTAKVLLAKSNHKSITQGNLKALKSTWSFSMVLLNLLNLFFLLLAFALFLLLNKIFESWPLALFISSQMFLISRIAFKYIRLCSFDRYIGVKNTRT